MFETTSTNASFTSETTTSGTSTAIARVGETLHAIFAHVMALEINSLTSFMLVVYFQRLCMLWPRNVLAIIGKNLF